MRHRRYLPAALLALALAAGCGGSSSGGSSGGSGGSSSAASNVSGSIDMVGVWTGPEQKNFQKVIDAFHEKYPNVNVKYVSGGNNITTVLSTAVAGGNPPDVADIAQPGFVSDMQKKGALKPIEFARPAVLANFGQGGVDIGSINGKLYGLLFKASNKSTIWYNNSAFQNAGVQPAKTWPDLLQAAKTLQASGVPAYSIGG